MDLCVASAVDSDSSDEVLGLLVPDEQAWCLRHVGADSRFFLIPDADWGLAPTHTAVTGRHGYSQDPELT